MLYLQRTNPCGPPVSLVGSPPPRIGGGGTTFLLSLFIFFPPETPDETGRRHVVDRRANPVGIVISHLLARNIAR